MDRRRLGLKRAFSPRLSVFGFQFELSGYRYRARTTKTSRLRLRRRFISLVLLAAPTDDAEISDVYKRPEKLTSKAYRIAPKSEIHPKQYST